MGVKYWNLIFTVCHKHTQYVTGSLSIMYWKYIFKVFRLLLTSLLTRIWCILQSSSSLCFLKCPNWVTGEGSKNMYSWISSWWSKHLQNWEISHYESFVSLLLMEKSHQTKKKNHLKSPVCRKAGGSY